MVYETDRSVGRVDQAVMGTARRRSERVGTSRTTREPASESSHARNQIVGQVRAIAHRRRRGVRVKSSTTLRVLVGAEPGPDAHQMLQVVIIEPVKEEAPQVRMLL